MTVSGDFILKSVVASKQFPSLLVYDVPLDDETG